MDKPYLLIAGNFLYPEAGTEDWIGCFETYEIAEGCIKVMETREFYKGGKSKGQVKSVRKTYEVSCHGTTRKCDWYEIVDLRVWAISKPVS